MKKLCSVMCIVLLCAGTLFAGGKQETVAEKKGVSITLSSPEESYPKDLLDVLANLYMQKNPGVTIITETFAGVPQIEYYKAKFATGDLPDVFFMNALDVGFVNAGAYMELPADIIEAAPDTAYNAFKGKFYQVINNQQVGGMFYNKKIFADLGIAIPKTQAELEAACEKIKAAGTIPIAIGFKDAWVGDYFLQGIMMSTDIFSKDKDWEIKRLKQEVKYASPDIVKVYKKFVSYIDKGYFGKGFMGNTYQQCEEIFATGKAAMFPMGNWFIGDLAQLKPSFETGWFTYPTESGKPFYVKGLGCSFSVSAQTKNPKEVLAFYKWLATSAESVALQSERMSLIPDVKEKVSYKADSLLLEIQKKIAGLDNAIWAYTQWGDNAPPPGAYDFCVKISQDVAAGADIEKSLKSLDEEFDKLLKSR